SSGPGASGGARKAPWAGLARLAHRPSTICFNRRRAAPIGSRSWTRIRNPIPSPGKVSSGELYVRGLGEPLESLVIVETAGVGTGHLLLDWPAERDGSPGWPADRLGLFRGGVLGL